MSKSRGFVCFWCDENGATIKKKVNGNTIYLHKECHREFLNQGTPVELCENIDNVRQIEQK